MTGRISAQVSLDGVRVVLYNGLWKPWSAGEERQTANRRKNYEQDFSYLFLGIRCDREQGTENCAENRRGYVRNQTGCTLYVCGPELAERTAVITLAGLINALKLVGKNIEDIKIVTSGAGSAAIAIVKLLMSYGAKDVTM